MTQPDGDADRPRQPPGTCPPGAAAFVVLAGGSGLRLGGPTNKAYLPLAGRPVVSWSLSWAADVPEVGPVVLVIRAEDAAPARAAVAASGAGERVEVVVGGETRTGSELAALDHLEDRIGSGDLQVVVLHDAARPLAGSRLLRTAIRTAAARGGAVPVIPVPGVWPARDGRVFPPRPGEELHGVQTPQAFRARPLLEAYAAVRGAGAELTDTAGALERFGDCPVVAIPGSADNLKVTYVQDLTRAEDLINAR